VEAIWSDGLFIDDGHHIIVRRRGGSEGEGGEILGKWGKKIGRSKGTSIPMVKRAEERKKEGGGDGSTGIVLENVWPLLSGEGGGEGSKKREKIRRRGENFEQADEL